ncbi:MAG: YggT family protein [Gammaproteobacteria bacterium]|nr:YggT family protein [Gammaproteobacteria bacterium]
MQALTNLSYFIVDSLLGLYIALLIIRILLAWVKADFYNPIAQFVIKATNPVVNPMHRVIPAWGRIDSGTWLLIFGFSLLHLYLILTLRDVSFNIIQIIPLAAISMAEKLITILLYAVMIRAVMSWFANPYSNNNPMLSILDSLTQPMLSLARRYIPAVGAIDLSAMAVIFVLYCASIILRSI